MKPLKHTDIPIRQNETIDSFLGGDLRLIQSKDGYRFSIDAVFLADFVTIREGDVVIDLGTGCGIVLLMLLLKKHLRMGIGLEIQHDLASQAARNALLNNFQNNMLIITGDLKQCPIKDGLADVVISNPPYRKARSGRINPDPRRAIARHEIAASLDDILKAACYLLRPKGRFAIVYPAERLADLLSRMRKYQLEAKKLQVHYPELDSEAKLVLVEAVLGGRPGLKIWPPLLNQGDFSIPGPS